MSLPNELRLAVLTPDELKPAGLAEIVALCNRAYRRDLSEYLGTFEDLTHVVGYLGDRIVCHALWLTRWLQVGDGPMLRTAYVEAVATEPEYQRKGYATAVMTLLAESVTDYDLAGLCPDDRAVQLYLRLGWQFWRGPLAIREPQGLTPTPTEWLMVLILPQTPDIDLDAPISAEWRPLDLW
jgi:aminoglycoside 2'-N-acetyltransferase I